MPPREAQRVDSAMYFRLLHDERSGAVSYLLADLDAGEAVLVDPRGADVPVLNAMLDEHQLRLRWLLRTHEHDALLTGEAAALDALGAPRIQHHHPVSEPHGEPGSKPSHAVLTFGNEHVQVLRTPGHTPGCLSYLWRDRLFCGGLLAVDACPFQPRPALPEALWDSVVNDVFKRPAETLLFTGHATRARAVSNVLEQRRWHPWFGGATRDEFLARVRTLSPAAATSTETPSTSQSQHEHTDDDLSLRTHH
jgi:glyoxylase-like metal-dependent hydrolase (beta-lactamase superfamily II)